MKRKEMKLILGALALTICGLVASSPAQERRVLGQETKVTVKFKNVSVPGAVETDVYAINNKNIVAGDYINAAGAQEGMFLKGSKATSFSCPSGQTVILGVNSAETGVADCGSSGAQKAPGPESNYIILAVDGGLQFIPTVCICNNPEGLGINDSEVVVGIALNEGQIAQGFTFDVNTGLFTWLDTPEPTLEPDPNPWSWGINNAGSIVLETTNPASGLADSFLYNGTSYTLINVPGARQSFAHGINNNGDIVYTFQDQQDQIHGALFLASTGEFYQFDDPSGVGTTQGFGINDEVAGETNSKLKIVGEYTSSGQNNAFEATVTIKP